MLTAIIHIENMIAESEVAAILLIHMKYTQVL